MERWNDRREYEDHWEGRDQTDYEEESGLNYNENLDKNEGGAEHTSAEEPVEYEAEYAAADDIELQFNAKFNWRSKARRAQRGRFVPPDTRGYPAPKFVPVADLRGEKRNQRRQSRPTAPGHDGLAN